MAAMAAGGSPGAAVMSEYYQAQELSTMVSALTQVVAGGGAGPWGEAPAASSSSSAWAGGAAPWGSAAPEQQAAMYGGYALEVGSCYHGAPSPDLAGNQTRPTRLLPSPQACAAVSLLAAKL
jgi:hypothetical protein